MVVAISERSELHASRLTKHVFHANPPLFIPGFDNNNNDGNSVLSCALLTRQLRYKSS